MADGCHLEKSKNVVNYLRWFNMLLTDKYWTFSVRIVCLLVMHMNICLLYTSDAADDLLCVDLGGRRIIKKKQFTYR